MIVGKHRVETRQKEMLNTYSEMGFNWHSVIRLNSFKEYSDYYTQPYNAKMNIGYVDRVMDNLVKRRNIDVAVAFMEQDDHLNNHLHFAWRCPIELTRKQIANSMRTKEIYLRDIRQIEGLEGAISYFSKHIYKKGTYNNLYV